MTTTWVLPNRNAFVSFVTDHLKTAHVDDAPSAIELFRHQTVARSFLDAKGPYRGLVLYHGLGSGKSCSSVIAAEAMLAAGMKAAVFVPASLRINYLGEVSKCGRELFRKLQTWEAVLKDSPRFTEACTGVGLDPTFVRRRRDGVVWIPVKGKDQGVPFKSMNDEQQQQVARQIDDMIQRRYTMYHYNGLSETVLNDMLSAKQHPLADHVIIVDEVHDLVSRAVGSGRTGKLLYQLLVTAPRAKVILLTGTPMINYPWELAYLVGIAKGYTSVFSLIYGDEVKPAHVLEALRAQPGIDLIDVREGNKKVARFTRLPYGFRWKDAGRTQVVADEAYKLDDETLYAKIVSELKGKVRPSAAKRSLVAPLPLDSDVFRSMFVDEDHGAILHFKTLANRIMGCISHFESDDKTVYPTVRETEIVKLPLSAHQWLQYEEVRMKERTMEDSSKRMRNMRSASPAKEGLFNDSAGVYRSFSRAVGNFAFPKDVRRPWPSSMREMLEQGMDHPNEAGNDDVVDPGDFELKGGNVKKKNKVAYDAALARALLHIRRNSTTLLTGQGLSDCSPKYAALIERLAISQGTSLVYSEFRNVEGLGVLSMALDAHGWSEFRLFKDEDGEWDVDTDAKAHGKRYASFDSDKDRSRILLAAFNSDMDALPPRIRAKVRGLVPGKDVANLRGDAIKLLQITKSGAQGISLRNVRQVHILEPYWNQIRIDQVIGRAVRAHSHRDLPPTERTVDVFMYVATLTKDQQKASITIRIKDNSLTSDEYILQIANKKAEIMEQLYDVMKRAAVDCSLWSSANDKGKCHDAPALGDEGALTSLDIEANAAAEDRLFGPPAHLKRFADAKEVRFKGKVYVWDRSTGMMYDADNFRRGRYVVVGAISDGRVELL